MCFRYEACLMCTQWLLSCNIYLCLPIQFPPVFNASHIQSSIMPYHIQYIPQKKYYIYFLRTTVCSPAIQYITCEAVIIKQNASSGENSQENDYIVVPLLFTQLSKSSGIFCRHCCASFRYNRRFLSVSSQWFDTAAPKPCSSYFRSSPLSLCGISL